MFVPLLATMIAAATPDASQTQEPKKPPPSHALEGETFFSIPMILGADVALTPSETSSGFFWGIRPELLAAWRQRNTVDAPLGLGVGVYAEAVGSAGTAQIFLGGGATIAGYFGHLGVAASGGVDVDWWHATPYPSPVMGLFVGFRTAELKGFDMPFGVRVDYRPPIGPLPSTVIIAAQLDVFVGAGAAFMGAMIAGMLH